MILTGNKDLIEFFIQKGGIWELKEQQEEDIKI